MNNPSLIRPGVRIRIPTRVPSLWLAIFLFAIGIGSNARAALILDLPELTLQPNQSGQSFTIGVQNTGANVFLNGVQLDLIVGDGSGGGPSFQAVSLVTPGTLFANNNSGDLGAGDLSGGLGQIFLRYTLTSSGTVALDTGTFDLATVTFDTTGVGLGDYSWSAASSPNGISYFTDMSGIVGGLTLIDGTLSVVPEPVNVALFIFGGLVVLIGGLHWRWRRKASTCRG